MRIVDSQVKLSLDCIVTIDFMHAFLVTTLAVICPFKTLCDLSKPLREAATERDIFIGTAANYNDLQSDSDYASVLGKQYDLITAENACKWSATEPSKNSFDFKECDYMYNYSLSKNQTFRGHNLCWGQYNPTWLEDGNFSANEKKEILENHITTVIEHYIDFDGNDDSKPVYCWDVVNEAVNDTPTNTSFYKRNIWYPDIPNYVDLAFLWAKNATQSQKNGNSVKLFYNDYDIIMSKSWMKTKSDAVYNMIKNMINNNIPIDGVGMQAHTHLDDDYPLDYDAMIENFKRYDDIGIEVHITELDMQCQCNGNFTSDDNKQQGEMYATILKACLNSKNCKNFETWGYTDKYTWLGSNEYPLPFDIDLNPKDAAYDILNTLLNKTSI